MISRIRTLGRVVLVTIGLLSTMAAAADGLNIAVRRHTQLRKSEPAANDSLTTSPRAIRLWFSEVVELPVTRVKLADAAGTTIALSRVTRPDTGQGAPVIAALSKTLSPGAYVVTWSTAAKDGHPAKGTFGFFLKATR